MSKLFRYKHQLWLEYLFASFSHTDEAIKNRLYEFSMIEFRHLKWLATHLYENNIAYDYSRDRDFNITHNDTFALISSIIKNTKNILTHYGDNELFSRMIDDERYFLYELESFLDLQTKPLTAFNKNLTYKNIQKDQIDKLVIFLFEELYKEYELIMIYFYQQTRANDVLEFSSFDDLIYESHFHLRSFGSMLAEVGLLALPRELHSMTYQITDFEGFLENGIIEEYGAKEQCKELSSAIKDEKLSKFFDFINLQESYHIVIMQKLLKRYK